MIQEQQLLGFKTPAKRPFATFRRYFLGNGYGPILGGLDEHVLDDPRDLVALAPTDDDRLSGFLRDNFGWCCRVSIPSLLISGNWAITRLATLS